MMKSAEGLTHHVIMFLEIGILEAHKRHQELRHQRGAELCVVIESLVLRVTEEEHKRR